MRTNNNIVLVFCTGVLIDLNLTFNRHELYINEALFVSVFFWQTLSNDKHDMAVIVYLGEYFIIHFKRQQFVKRNNIKLYKVLYFTIKLCLYLIGKIHNMIFNKGIRYNQNDCLYFK